MADDALRELLEHARRTTARYARSLPPLEEPLPTDLDALFSSLPPLSRRDLQRYPAAHRSTELEAESCWIVRSSGSTGEPVEVVVDAPSRQMEARILAEQADRFARTRTWRERDWFHLALHPEATSRALVSPWNPARRVVKWNLTNAWRAPEREWRSAISRLDGAVATGLPSTFELLARRIVADGAPAPRPALVLLSGEELSASTRSLIADAFDAPVTMAYTLAETGVVASECATAGEFHVETDAARIEILREDSAPAGEGEAGELVLTPLALRSTVLLRYRSGDRGVWVTASCGCGRRAPRFRLAGARSPARLVSVAGTAVNVVRFGKLLATLALEKYAWRQDEDGAVTLVYRARRELPEAARALVAGAVRAALGPAASVRFAWVSEDEAASRADFEGSLATEAEGRADGTAGSSPRAAADWLRERLADERGIVAGALTGSALDVLATTRFSDLDLVLLVDGNPHASRWLDLASDLETHLPRLHVAVDSCPGLPLRAPLLVCRLHSEQLLVAGRLDEERLPWPTREALAAEARIASQEACAALWQLAVGGLSPTPDPVLEAWRASKHVLRSLRHRELLRGGRTTAASALLERLQQDPDLPRAWVADVDEMVAVARELAPPPLPELATARRYHLAAMWIARRVAVDSV